MATLRELVGKIVFRSDPTQLEDFDAKLDAAKAKLFGLDASAKKGVRPVADVSPLLRLGNHVREASEGMKVLAQVSKQAYGSVKQDVQALDAAEGNLEQSTQELRALRLAVKGVDGAISPEKARQYDEAFKGAKKRATDLRGSLERLRLIDPKNPKLPGLEKQLDEVEKEALETAAALKRVGTSAAEATKPASFLSSTLAKLGAAAAAYKAVSWANGVLKEADAVGKLAAQLGIGTDELQVWSAFASQAGATNEDLRITVKSLAKNIETVAKTAKGPAAEAMKKLGVETSGWKKELPSTMDVLLELGGALGDMESSTERVALAQQVLGEASLKLLPGFKNGSKSAKEQVEALKDLAIVYDKDFIESAEAANDEMGLVEMQFKGIGSMVLMTVLPGLRSLMRWLAPVAKSFRSITQSSNILTAAMGGLGLLGISMLGPKIAALVARFGGLTNVLKMGGRFLLRFVLPLLILDDVITFLRGGDSVIGKILDKMFGMGAAESVLEGVKKTWEGLTGGVEYFWGLMKGDQAAIDAGEAKIMQFGGFVDDVFAGLGETFSEWGDMFAEAWDFALRDMKAMFTGWGDELQEWLKGVALWFYVVWDTVGTALSVMLSRAGEKVKSFVASLPLIGKLFDDEEPAGEGNQLAGDPATARMLSNARSGLAQGGSAGEVAERMLSNARSGLALGGSPSVSNSTKSTSVSVQDNSTMTMNLNGVNAENLGTALRATEENLGGRLERSRIQTLRQVVGAAGA